MYQVQKAFVFRSETAESVEWSCFAIVNALTWHMGILLAGVELTVKCDTAPRDSQLLGYTNNQILQ